MYININDLNVKLTRVEEILISVASFLRKGCVFKDWYYNCTRLSWFVAHTDIEIHQVVSIISLKLQVCYDEAEIYKDRKF